MNYSLMPIRIPSGWEVFSNRLYQIGDINQFIAKNNSDEIIYHLDTGLLALIQRHIGLEVYVDWYPAMDINGQYHLNIWSSQPSQQLFHYTNRDIQQLISVLEEKIANIHSLLHT